MSVVKRSWRALCGVVRWGLDRLLPPLCLSCDQLVVEHNALCPTCWGKLHFTASPQCPCCGMPYDTTVGDDALCGACLAEPPRFTSARAALIYDDASRGLVLGFKHGDRIGGATTMATWMMRAAPEAAAGDLVVPVPLHWRRLFLRRYNQAALLAKPMAGAWGKAYIPDLLRRHRATDRQGHKGRKERADNVRGVFSLNGRYRDHVRGKTVILVDDVVTTGATVNECCRVLLGAGAVAVHVVTLARVRQTV